MRIQIAFCINKYKENAVRYRSDHPERLIQKTAENLEISVSDRGVLKCLGVSRTGYNAWKRRCPSAAEKYRRKIKTQRVKPYIQTTVNSDFRTK